MIGIGSNISSLRSQRRLAENATTLARAFERLSSGQRINRASDDAAGLAIADSLRANGRLYAVAQRNINDSISAGNILDAALSQQQQILSRLSELAEQSANGVYSDEQRTALNSEYRALVNEMNRISAATTFNGVRLLAGKRSGNMSQLNMQVGIDGSVESLLNMTAPDTGFLSGTVGVLSSFDGNSTLSATDSVAVRHLIEGASSLDEIADPLCGALASIQVVDSEGQQRDVYVALLSGKTALNTPVRLAYAFERTDTGAFHPLSVIIFSQQSVNTLLDFGSGITANMRLDLSTLSVQKLQDGPVDNSCLDFSGVETAKRARQALEFIGNRQAEMSLIQSQVGALQSRFEAALATVLSSGVNCNAAESRIRDSDIAEEAAALVRGQILQQVALSVLTQANEQPRTALQLLRNDG